MYGTLMAEEVLSVLLGRVPVMRPAWLVGYERWFVKDAAFPAILEAEEPSLCSVDGRLLEGLSARDLRALDYFEDDRYVRTIVTVTAPARTGSTAGEAESCRTTAYVWTKGLGHFVDLGRPWSYEAFRAQELTSYLEDPVRTCATEFALEEARGDGSTDRA